MTSEIVIRKWVKRGNMLYATDGLDWDDLDHPYNQAKAQGVVPEDFGLQHPLEKRFEKYSRSDLIQRIIDLEKENLSYGFNGF